MQDNEKKRLRDFRECFEEEGKGKQAGCISQGDFLCEFVEFYCCCWRSYCMDPYNKEEGMVFEVVCGHKNLRLIEVLLAAKEAIQFFPYN